MCDSSAEALAPLAKQHQHVVAEVHGSMEPLPPSGSLLARWRVDGDGDWSQDIYVRRANNVVYLALAGEQKAELKPAEERSASCMEVVSRGGTGVWFEAILTSMDPAIEVRIMLQTPEQLVMERRSVCPELHALREDVRLVNKMWQHVLAVTKTTTSEKPSTYKGRKTMRLSQLSKIQGGLRPIEETALETHPAQRSQHQRSVVALYLARMEELRASSLENTNPWGQRVTARRMPSMTTSCLDWMLSKPAGKVHPVSAAYADPENCARLCKAGWYSPAKARQASCYPGLQSTSSVELRSHFRFNPRLEIREPGQVHLACYVGEGAAGYLSSELEQVARLLDDGFDGLCVHGVPDLKPDHISGFTLGAIVGASSSGKTTLARERFGGPIEVQWLDELPALAHFASFGEAEPALAAAALDLEIAMRPAGLLSGGERERASIARGLADWAAGRREILVIDEFTSLLDRPTAQRLARGINMFLHKRPALKGLVVLSCHVDIIGHGLLEPDWVFDCGDSRLDRFDRKLSTESTSESVCDNSAADDVKIPRSLDASTSSASTLIVRRAVPCEWREFREHHYKDHRLQSSSVCFVGELQGRAVAFTSVINTGFTLRWVVARNNDEQLKTLALGMNMPLELMKRNAFREHRTVVLPDCQGLGLGSLMADAVAQLLDELGYAFMSVTAHPTYGGYRDRSPLWARLPSSGRERAGNHCATYSHAWRGAVEDEARELLKQRVALLDDRPRIQDGT
eukprot:TRINITY_DN58942_c0_g1_i1.p1 TRINITY_DN58942_c0_g1~~TRINITY_DN58942_c0_g1_i1.p1  ORF type:complete len:744 (-),score=107.76 TRINITY_DN58942_c0_g1_i1:145-2376(-)